MMEDDIDALIRQQNEIEDRRLKYESEALAVGERACSWETEDVEEKERKIARDRNQTLFALTRAISANDPRTSFAVWVQRISEAFKAVTAETPEGLTARERNLCGTLRQLREPQYLKPMEFAVLNNHIDAVRKELECTGT